MFRSLVRHAVSATSATSPRELSLIALAFERYQQTGDFLIDDAYLESCLAAALKDREGLKDFALFGMKNHLRVVLRGEVMQQDVEATIAVKPVDVHWGSYYRFVFDVEVLRWEVQGTPAKLAGAALRRMVSTLIPLGGLLSMIGQAAIHKAVKSAGVAHLADVGELGEHGVTWDGGRATLDLSAQPGLAAFFQSAGDEGLQSLLSTLGQGTSMAAQFRVTDLDVDRSGLILTATLSPPLRAAFSASAQAFQMLKGSAGSAQRVLADSE